LAVLLGVLAVRLLVVGAGLVAFATAGAFLAGRAAYVAPVLPTAAVQEPSAQTGAEAQLPQSAGAQLSQDGAAQHGGGQAGAQQRRRRQRAEASFESITKATSPTPAIIRTFFIVQVSVVEVSYPPKNKFPIGPRPNQLGVAIRGKQIQKSSKMRRMR
jgi:hypothetical protein